MRGKLLWLVFLFKVIHGSALRPEIPPSTCLHCICQASSNCDIRNLKCSTNSDYTSYCGPYQITRGYWEDGNSIGYDFETCANLKACAERVIINYMKKYARDCNGDGHIDCNDYAAIHLMGADRCNDASISTTDYWKVFKTHCPANNKPLTGIISTTITTSVSNFNDTRRRRRKPTRQPNPASSISSLIPSEPSLMPDTSIDRDDDNHENDGLIPEETRRRHWNGRRNRPRFRNTRYRGRLPTTRPSFIYLHGGLNFNPFSDPSQPPEFPFEFPGEYLPGFPSINSPGYGPFIPETVADDYSTSPPLANPTSRRPTRTRTTARTSPASSTAISRIPGRTRGTTIPETAPTTSPTRTSTTRRRKRPSNRRRTSTTPRSMPVTELTDLLADEPRSVPPSSSTTRPRSRPRTVASNNPSLSSSIPATTTTVRNSVTTTRRTRPRNNRTNRRPINLPTSPVMSSITPETLPTDPINDITSNDALSSDTFTPESGYNQPGGITISNERPSTFIPDVNDLEEDPLDPLPPPIPGMNRSITITDTCLRCLCESSETCLKKGSCPNRKGPCGPFMLTYNQWNSVGKPKGDFVKCASNYQCSQDVIRKLLIKNAADCNNDVLINCVDFAIAYKSGSTKCSSETENLFNSHYWSNFETCYGFDRR